MTRAPLLLACLLLVACAGGGGDERDPGAAQAREASPERHIVFTRDVGTARQSLWITDGTGRNARRLIDGAAGTVSPDGRWVAFDRCRTDACAYDEQRGSAWVISSRGGAPRRLHRRAEPAGWLPDSRTVVVKEARRLLAIDRATGGRRELVRGVVGDWSVSPDGTRLVASVERREQLGPFCGRMSDLVVVPVRGGAPRRLGLRWANDSPVWETAGITFMRVPPGCFEAAIWRVRPDGSAERRVAHPPLRWSRHGYYGFRPFRTLPGRRMLIGIRSEWGDVPAVLDLRTKRVREFGGAVDHASRDGRLVLAVPYSHGAGSAVVVAPAGTGPRREIARGRICCAHWNW